MAFFSVVIPLYNKEKYIQRAIKSVLAQTVQDFELIIVDDGSTDGSYEAANKIKDPRIRIIRQENRGVSAARNRGVSEAKYNWVAFLDADDEWLPEFLNAICKLQEDFPNEKGFTTSYFQKWENRRIDPTLDSRFYSKGYRGKINFFRDWDYGEAVISSSSVVLHKEAIKSIGGFPEEIKIREDNNTWIRFSLKYEIACNFLPLVQINYDASNRAFTRNINEPPDKHYNHAEFLIALKKQGQIPKKSLVYVNDLIAKYSFPMIDNAIKNSDFFRSYKLLAKCLISRKYWKTWFKYFLKTCLCLLLNSISFKHEKI